MSYDVEGFLEGTRILTSRLEHLPRTGEAIHFDNTYYTVLGVTWQLDQTQTRGERVDLELEVQT